MSGLQSENFLAYKRSGRYGSKVELEVGVSYDFAAEIDERNHWSEPGDQPDHVKDLHDELIKVSAAGFRELMLWCFQGHPLTRTGRGMQIAFRKFCAVAFSMSPTNMRVPKDGTFHQRTQTPDSSTPITLQELAEMPQLRCDAKTLRQLAKEFRKRFPFTAHVQRCKAKRA